MFALFALVLALPVLAVLASWLQWTPQTLDLLREMAATVLPDYAWTSAALCLMVALGVTVLGLGTAAAVTLFDFRGRALFEWLLLLPLAMPAYVVAYAYTDFLQFSGPLQMALRNAFGWKGALWPDVRSVWGAALVFTVSLYPYVYLLARTALLERVATLMEAARLLGASLVEHNLVKIEDLETANEKLIEVVAIGTAGKDDIVVFAYSGTNLAAGERLQFSSNGGSTWADVSAGSINTSSKTVTLSGLSLSANPTVQLRVADAVGNATGTLISQAISYDNTAPTLPSFTQLSLSADTGTAGDFITQTAGQTVSATLSSALSGTSST